MLFTIFTRNDETSKEIEQVCYEKMLKNNFIEDKENPEIVICIGGDGTFLRAVQHFFSKISSITFVGIRSGTLGYFYAYEQDQIDLLIDDLLNNKII